MLLSLVWLTILTCFRVIRDASIAITVYLMHICIILYVTVVASRFGIRGVCFAEVRLLIYSKIGLSLSKAV